MYFGVLKSYWKESIAYRAEFMFSIFAVPLRFLVIILVWAAVYSRTDSVGGYGLSDLITYFIVSSLILSIIHDTVAQEMENEVRNGYFMTYLLQPVHYIKLKFLKKVSNRSFALVVEILPIILIFIIFFNKYLVAGNIFLTILSLALAFVISYFIYLLIGCLAFWFINIRSFTWFMNFFILLASGGFFPIDLFPKAIQKVMHFLPFSSINYIPVSVYLGKYSSDLSLGFSGSVYEAFLIQLTWVLVLFVIVLIVWKFARKKFSGVGV